MGRDRARRPEAESQRLFIAVDIPSDAAVALERAVEPWCGRLAGVRWVPRQNWHVTLKFLGRTWPRLVPMVMEEARGAAGEVSPFTVRLGGMGVFPGPSLARVLCAGILDDEEGLRRLAGALDRRLAAEFPPEKRGFSAHLTVGRLNPPVNVREHAEDLAAVEIGAPPFAVDRLVVYRSHLSPRGARYEPVEIFPLAGAADAVDASP